MQEEDFDKDLFVEVGDLERRREGGVQLAVISPANDSGEFDPDDQAFIL